MRVFYSIVCFIFILAHSGMAQSATYLKLTHKKKAKTVYIKVGNRVKIIDRLGNETMGRMIAIDSNSIRVNKESIPLPEIHSIAKRSSAGVEVIGAIISGAGIIMILVSISPAADAVTGEQVRQESSLIGGALVAGGMLMLIRKSYSKRKWTYTVE